VCACVYLYAWTYILVYECVSLCVCVSCRHSGHRKHSRCSTWVQKMWPKPAFHSEIAEIHDITATYSLESHGNAPKISTKSKGICWNHIGGGCSPILDVLSAAGLKIIIYTGPPGKLTFSPTPLPPARQPPCMPGANCCWHLHGTFKLSTSPDGVHWAEIQGVETADGFSTNCCARACPFLPRARVQQPGQDPRNTHKVAPQAGAARLGPEAAACRSLFARRRQKLQGRTNTEAARQSGHGSPGTRGHTSSSGRVWLDRTSVRRPNSTFFQFFGWTVLMIRLVVAIPRVPGEATLPHIVCFWKI